MVASACPGREEEATVKDYAKYLPVFINRTEWPPLSTRATPGVA
jgi:hypothetical protein